ncbi:MAG: hypothetical protein N3B13_04940 [Deltaproteobacteria bacterium]|nr:hypothetical protein [Deltaproteobacteria bacterium]
MIFTVFTIGFLSCSSEPCEDLKEKAESCTDNEVKALLLKVAKDGDKQECTDFLNSFYHTFGSRCISEIKDATTVSDAESD